MESIKIKDYMTFQPLTLNKDTPLITAVESLFEHECLGAPVIDQQKKLIGFLSEEDCLSVMLKRTYHCDMMMKVSDCMRTEVLSVDIEANILAVAESMVGQKPKMYPVLDDDKVVGLITRTQILQAICKHLNSGDNPV